MTIKANMRQDESEHHMASTSASRMYDAQRDYHPRSVTRSVSGGMHEVVDDSYGNQRVIYRGSDEAAARRAQTVRQGVIKGALTRRSNKAQSARHSAAAEAGVSYDWLRETMSAPEADAWLGLDK